MTATSGLRCLELSESAGRLGCLQRMLLGTSRWVSTRCWLTWKAKTTPQGRLLFQLVPRTHHIEETESGLWRTPAGSDGVGGIMKMHKDKDGHYKLRDQVQGINREFWPTPRSCTAMSAENIQNRVNDKFPNLESVVAQRMWPTPTAQDAKNNGGPSQMERNSLPLNAEVGGSLNPAWVEWLMGYSPGWTDCEDLETPLSRESPMKSSGQ